jgi:hypothetical protein
MPDEFDKAMDQNELNHPGIHERLYDYLMKLYPGEPLDAEEFFSVIKGRIPDLSYAGCAGRR